MENEINNIPEHGLYTFEQVKENKEEFAKMFSEGNKELEKCLLKLWNNNIPTLACCGDEATFFGASKIDGAFVFLEKPAYISIETTNMKKGNTFQKMAGQICKGRNLPPKVLKNTLALLNQMIKYFQNLGVIERTCNFQVKRLTDKNKFSINRIIFEV